MGLGMPLIASMAARMDVQTGETGTRVCMCFPTPAPAASARDGAG
jgi:hypothetical protein